MDHRQWGIVIEKNLCILLLEHSVTWAFNLQRRSWPKRGIGHSGIYKKLCFRVMSIRKLISSFLTVNFTGGSCGEIEIGHLKPKEAPGSVHSSEWEALAFLFLFLLMFQPRAIFLPTPFFLTVFPPQWVTCLPGIQWCRQKSVLSFDIFFILLFPVEHLKSNICQLIRVHSKSSI